MKHYLVGTLMLLSFTALAEREICGKVGKVYNIKDSNVVQHTNADVAGRTIESLTQAELTILTIAKSTNREVCFVADGIKTKTHLTDDDTRTLFLK